MKFSEMSKEELEVELKGVGSNRKGGSGRKEELLEILKGGLYSVKELGEMIGISNRNVSSIICYLRDDGFGIKKIGNNRLVLWDVIRDGVKSGNRMVLGKDGKLVRYNFEKLMFEDEIVKGTCLTHDKEIVHERVKESIK